MFAEPGDIIDEINGTSLRNASIGQVRSNLSHKKYVKCILETALYMCTLLSALPELII